MQVGVGAPRPLQVNFSWGSDIMPMIKTSDSVNAAATLSPWVGSQYEYLPWNAAIAVALLGDAASTFQASVYSGSDVLLQNSPIDVLAVATPIVYPDHFTLTDIAAAGERISAQITNGGGAAAVVRTQVRIDPIG